MPESSSSRGAVQPHARVFKPLVMAVMVAVVSYLLVTVCAIWAYSALENRERDDARAQLSRVASGNAALVSYWLTEDASDVRVLASTSRVRTEFESYLHGSTESKNWLSLRLEAERESRNYVSITLFDTSGRARLIFGEDSPGHVQDLARYAVQAAKMTTGTVVSTHPGENGSFHMSWFAPLRIEDEPGHARTTGVVMYESDLKGYLQQVVSPIDEPWPTTVALRVSELADTYVASTATDFSFAYVHGTPYPGGDVIVASAPVDTTNMDIVAFVGEKEFSESLATERWITAGLDFLVLFTFVAFVIVYARSDKNRRKEMLAKEQIADALATQDRFLANMSHDLRTPLNSIIGFSSVLEKGMAGPLNDEQLRQIGMIEASGRHLLAMVTDVLDLSKMKAGMEEVDPETFRLFEVTDFITDVLAPQVTEKGLTWSVVVPPDIEVTTDRRLLERILLNLAGNAVKFTVNGGIEVVATRRMGEVAIEVHDTGPGIEQGTRREIMREFRQVYRPGSRKPEGSGLGLAICERTAELLGGRIDVESVPGQGATFTLVLPAGGALL